MRSGRLSKPEVESPSLKPKLGGEHDLIAKRRDGLADQLFVREGPVGLRGVEEGDSLLERASDERERALLLDGGPVREAEAHAPQT